ncbi:MAG: RNA-directed DNA polymerase [Pseudomonadota bacterium]
MKTEKGLKALSSFYFPTQLQIENVVGIRFDKEYSTEDLVRFCIPKVISYEDATFCISINDIDVVRNAELNYVFQNDEAQSRVVINELSNLDSENLLNRVELFIEKNVCFTSYMHERNEGNKTRVLVSLGATERVVTSCIMKQLIYFLDIDPSVNSYGYSPNKGFSEGYIFKPWLYLWINFLSNISSAIELPCNKEFYIVKTDIKGFYDNIPHDNLKRLLLGGVNSRIDKNLNILTEEMRTKYKELISILFYVTKNVTESNIGLPQGPAYARYLAELYLDNIDSKFENEISAGKIILYQRYVDDMFFIVETEDEAKKILADLTADLDLLGLNINNEKTIISKIKNFSTEFNSYRSQSKYAVDSVSRNFDDATNTQKNLALNEFMKLVQSDSCNDDLAFIFSHLTGVEHVNDIKREIVTPTLIESIGRGSVYKHLFNFILEDPQNWELLYQAPKLSNLQSEVLTSSIINNLDANESDRLKINSLIVGIDEKLSKNELVNEHLAYLYLKFGTNIKIESIPPETIIRCMTSFIAVENLNITTELIVHINTELNNIKSIAHFLDAIYPLCASLNTGKEDLNKLSLTFYAKFSLTENDDIEFIPALAVQKFYYLLCLFSLSSANSSIDLLKGMWKKCIGLYNEHDIYSGSSVVDNWLIKIKDIDLHQKKALVVIAAIVDGNIVRGVTDKQKIFERFHSIIFIYITMSKLLQDNSVIASTLEYLKGKADFYKWLIENNDVIQFPENKLWFERNVIENSVVLLKKGNSILIRRPSDEFVRTDLIKNEHNGYSETIVNYNQDDFVSIKEVISTLTIKQLFDIMLDTINLSYDTGLFPNIYCNDRVLLKDSLQPFCSEMNNSKHLIFESIDGSVRSLKNNPSNFISFFLSTASTGLHGNEIKRINDKYINNLNSSVDILEFIKKTSSQLPEIKGVESEFHYDVALAAALHLSLSDLDIYRRIDKFVEQYHKFNPKVDDRHIFCVNKEIVIKDSNPLELLEVVEKSLELLITESMPSLALYLAKDLKEYKSNLEKAAQFEGSDIDSVNPRVFKKAFHKISHISEVIHINGIDYEFRNVYFINPITMETQKLESKHSTVINSSEHIYYFEDRKNIFLIAIHSAISKMYISIKERYKKIIETDGHSISYPLEAIPECEIIRLKSFDASVSNISIHRHISIEDSKCILTKWLRSLPSKFHQPFVTLIAAHEVMNEADIKTFLDTVLRCIKDEKMNPFLIKHLGDYNGTHRLLYKKDDDIGRQITSLEPINISDAAEQATIIVDNIISGSQIIKAIKYYITGTETGSKSNYFSYNEDESVVLKDRLKKLRKINICTVLYTNKSIVSLNEELKELLNPEIEIEIICGRAIDGSATFEKTEKINEKDKDTIRELLGNKDNIKILNNYLEHDPNSRSNKNFDEDSIDGRNLIARYQSLPKRCFEFLHMGLRHNDDCHPFIRVKETYEK